MKFNRIYYSVIAIATLCFGCKKDNYDTPNAGLTGKLIDANTKGVIPGAVGNASFGDLQLFQLDYGAPIPTAITSAGFKIDGSYGNTYLFNGRYKIVPRGAYFYKDTMVVDVKGSTVADIKIVPYTYVTLVIGTITNNSISITVNATRNPFADATTVQKIANVAAVLGITEGVNINNYLNVNGNATDYRFQVNTEGIPNETVNTTPYAYVFSKLKANTTYYIRGGARVSTGNPSNYYNYSTLAEVKTLP